jgi:hypothetical protein
MKSPIRTRGRQSGNRQAFTWHASIFCRLGILEQKIRFNWPISASTGGSLNLNQGKFPQYCHSIRYFSVVSIGTGNYGLIQ